MKKYNQALLSKKTEEGERILVSNLYGKDFKVGDFVELKGERGKWKVLTKGRSKEGRGFIDAHKAKDWHKNPSEFNHKIEKKINKK